MQNSDQQAKCKEVHSSSEGHDKDGFEMKIAENSDDSVYESTYQNIDKAQHPSLRASKLTKRIMKDKHLTPAKRNALKARRNIITHRRRKKRVETEAELLNRVIPALQRTVS